jgi:pimeloyl-ACP methyl ester carboxylesterase
MRRGTLPIFKGNVNYVFHPAPSTVSQSRHPPTVLFGGTAQTINSLVGHRAPLATLGGLLHYELRGQGRTTNLSLENCSLAQQVEDFQALMDCNPQFCDDEGRVNLCGFSFGGRVALAIAAKLPERVSRLVCTGVPAHRSATGRTILRAWRSSLEAGNLDSFMWQSMVDGFSPEFLARHESRLPQWVESAVAANRSEAIASLVAQTHTYDVCSPWHTVSLAQQASANGLQSDKALFLVGGQDRLASPESCADLCGIGGWECRVIEGAAHSVPIEQPRLWREAVVSHLAA